MTFPFKRKGNHYNTREKECFWINVFPPNKKKKRKKKWFGIISPNVWRKLVRNLFLMRKKKKELGGVGEKKRVWWGYILGSVVGEVLWFCQVVVESDHFFNTAYDAFPTSAWRIRRLFLPLGPQFGLFHCVIFPWPTQCTYILLSP